jgi:hypothetical protein
MVVVMRRKVEESGGVAGTDDQYASARVREREREREREGQ